MLYTISRPPTDDHTFFMIRDLLKNTNKDWYQGFYIWSTPPDFLLNFLDRVKFDKPIVILAIKDLLDGWQDFNWWHDTQQVIVKKLSKMARTHPDIKFILFTSLENLHKELCEPNVYVVPWGGDIVNQKAEYKQISPVLDKNFDSSKTFICLNRNRRDHRIVNASYVLGTGLAPYGEITFLSLPLFIKDNNNFLDYICWEFDEQHPNYEKNRSAFIEGYSLLTNNNHSGGDIYEIYSQPERDKPNDNAYNFDKRLRPKYQNSFVEIVTESSFCAPSFIVTEKTQNAVYGCNFPILLGGVGIVQNMRNIGLDVFDDVIDHSYDLIAHPFDRITTAIDANRHVLTDADYVKQKWAQCRSRFEANVDTMRNIYSWYDRRTKTLFEEVVQKIC